MDHAQGFADTKPSEGSRGKQKGKSYQTHYKYFMDMCAAINTNPELAYQKLILSEATHLIVQRGLYVVQP